MTDSIFPFSLDFELQTVFLFQEKLVLLLLSDLWTRLWVESLNNFLRIHFQKTHTKSAQLFFSTLDFVCSWLISRLVPFFCELLLNGSKEIWKRTMKSTEGSEFKPEGVWHGIPLAWGYFCFQFLEGPPESKVSVKYWTPCKICNFHPTWYAQHCSTSSTNKIHQRNAGVVMFGIGILLGVWHDVPFY